MLKYTIYRIIAAVLAIIAAIVITFFAMHLIPGMPQPPSGAKTLVARQEWWSQNGFLYEMGVGYTNSAQQFGWFVSHLNKQFGVYFGSQVPVVTYFDNSMLVTIAYALPAFIFSTIFGVGMGYYAAKYQGKVADSVINIIAVVVSSIPVFVLGILLFELAGVIHLPAEYVAFAPSNSALKSYESLILPTVVVTLMGLPSVVFMSRNEFTEIFKSEYIKTARGKGLSNFQIFRKHIIRNAFMPILYATSGNLLLIFGGSIIIQMIFNIAGNATGQGLGQMLADGVTSHQYYFECFSILFFGGVFFLYAIFLDWMYVLVDPRVTLRAGSELLGFKVLKARHDYKSTNYIVKKLNLKSAIQKRNLNHREKVYMKIMGDQSIQWNSLNYFKNSDYLVAHDLNNGAPTFTDVKEVQVPNTEILVANPEQDAKALRFHIKDLEHLNVDPDIGEPTNKKYNFNEVKLFKPVDSLKIGGDSIGGSNVPTWISSLRIFAHNKIALIFALIMIGLILFCGIFAFASPYSASSAITNSVSISALQFLPPRFPGMSVHSIIEYHIYSSTLAYKEALAAGIVDTSKPILHYAGSNLYYVWIYPYAQSGLQNIFPVLGTNKYGIDYLTELSYAFSRVVLFTVVVILGSTVLGLIYGGIQGSFAGSNADIIMQWITQIILSVPTLLWVIIFGVSFTGGTLTLWNLAWILIIITWPGIASITRLYVIKYKDYEFVQAARIIGMGRFRIVMTHLLPNTFGKVTVFALNSFGGIMQWPSFLLFIGLTSSFGISLSTIIFDAYSTSSMHWNLMLSVMMLYVFPYLAFQVIANAINDSLDSRN